MAVSSTQFRAIVENAGTGGAPALDQLMPLVYKELRRLAAGHLRHERRNHTLQPTGLVHEVYLRLAENDLGDLREPELRELLADAASRARLALVEDDNRAS